MLKRKDQEDENEGGSSQDKFESDFIDDDASKHSESDGEFDVKKAEAKIKRNHDDLPSEDEEEEYMSDKSEERQPK